MRKLVRPGLPLLVLSLFLACYAAELAGVVAGAPLVPATALVVAGALEIVVGFRAPGTWLLLRRARLGVSQRTLIQTSLVLLLLAREAAVGRLGFLLVAGLVLAVPGTYVGFLGLLSVARRRVVPPLQVRGLALPERFIPASLPRLLTDLAPPLLLAVGVYPVLVAAALGVRSGGFWGLYVTAALCGTVLAGCVAWVAYLCLRLPHLPSSAEFVAAAGDALRPLRPEVVLYHSGPANTAYQVETWLTTLERMRRRCVLLLRERDLLRVLPRTDLPVLCIPSSVDVMNLELPDLRVALYTANVGNNIHLLRRPRVKHVFVGHGDSDKVGSFNPFSKVYDQVWVAGPAGRERYARARVGVLDSAVVEVGRPQVDGLRRTTGTRPPTPEAPLTVLYLPSWEGWTDEEFQTSLTSMGQELVRRLLAGCVPVRVVYRPHPMTGQRDRQARAADLQLRATVRAASAGRPPLDPRAAEGLESLRARLRSDKLTPADERRLDDVWSAQFWAAEGTRHVVVAGRLPSLFDCFDQADLLVSDVSGVVSDFLATGKPYVVANPKGLAEQEFRRLYPTASAAYVLSPGCEEVDDILAAVTGDDPMASARLLLRRHLLGPDEPPALARWDAAVDRLVAAADAEWDGSPAGRPKADALSAPGQAEGTSRVRQG